MRTRITAAAAMMAASAGIFSADAQDGTLIGLQQNVSNGPFTLVTVQTSTGQVTTLANEPGVGNITFGSNSGYNNLNNTFSFEYNTSVTGPVRLRTVNAANGQTISDIQTSSASFFPAYDYLTPLTPNLGNFTTLDTTGLATLNSASVTNGLSVGGGATVGGALSATGLSTLNGGVQTTTLSTTGAATLNSASVTNDLAVGGGATVGGALSVNGLATLSGGVQTTTVNAATSVATPSITATTGNIQTVHVGTALTVASGGTVNMGGNRIQNVAAPAVATDAATKGYVDTSVTGIASSFNSGLNQALKKIDQNSQGIAIAMAMSGVSLSPDKNAVIGGNLGFYNGNKAAAFQGAIRMDQNITLSGGLGFGLQDKAQVGGRFGLQVEF
jgi:hypothetical protein